MALPLRCARSRAALPVSLPSTRAAKLSTSVARQQLNSDVKITRYPPACPPLPAAGHC